MKRSHVTWAVAMFLLGIVGLWTLYLIRSALLVLYVSTILAIGFSPIVQWIERWRMPKGKRPRPIPRWLAILVLYVGVLGIFGTVLGVVLPPLVTQSRELWLQLPAYLESLQGTLLRRHIIDHTWTINDLLKASNPDAAVSGLLGAVQGVIGGVLGVVTILLLTYYLLVEADSLRAGLLRFVAKAHRPQVARAADDATQKVGAWLRGQLFLAVVIGVTTAIGLWALGVPYLYVLALIAAIGEMVPIVGPLLAAIPAVLVGSYASLHTGVFVAVYFSIQQFIEGNVLVPRVMERQVGVSPLTVVIALVLGSELAGAAGALLAVPSAAIVQVVLHEYLERDDP